jgi:NAD(P)-dependent dehydrogenase (short-subunit alcohol dehydrogenase family)
VTESPAGAGTDRERPEDGGEVAVVTGAASGIGLAIARQLLADGYRVAVTDVDVDGAERAVEALAAPPGRSGSFPVDVSDVESVELMMDQVEDRLGPVGVLCNNAGIMDGFLPAGETPDDIWDRVLAVNLTGPFLLTRRALQTMVARGQGAIVNTVSVAGLSGGRAGAAYTASKHGLIGLTKNVAWQYAHQGIRCNAVCPGGVSTNMDSRRDDAPPAARARSQVLLDAVVRMGEPEEIAAVVAFLASPAASLVNGSIVSADAGWMAG